MQRETRVLKKKVTDLEAKVQQLQSVEAANAELKATIDLLNAKLNEGQKVIIIIIMKPKAWRRILLENNKQTTVAVGVGGEPQAEAGPGGDGEKPGGIDHQAC